MTQWGKPYMISLLWQWLHKELLFFSSFCCTFDFLCSVNHKCDWIIVIQIMLAQNLTKLFQFSNEQTQSTFKLGDECHMKAYYLGPLWETSKCMLVIVAFMVFDFPFLSLLMYIWFVRAIISSLNLNLIKNIHTHII